ncbi:MAG: sugar transporter, partial [Flavobacteriaceae bacterium]
MEDEFKISDYTPVINFKDLFFKILKNWWLYVLFLVLSFITAYQINLRKRDKFSIKSQFVVSNDKNPFFTSNTNLTFNWGGASDKIQTTTTLFKSRTHNEKVVEYLQYYVNYKKQ